jgi:hypothetical protein
MEQLKQLVAAQAVRNKHLPKEATHKGQSAARLWTKHARSPACSQGTTWGKILQDYGRLACASVVRVTTVSAWARAAELSHPCCADWHTPLFADKLEQTKLAERAQKEAAKAEREKHKVEKEEVRGWGSGRSAESDLCAAGVAGGWLNGYRLRGRCHALM